MAASVLFMSMSPDGYIAGPNDEPGNPGGDGFAWSRSTTGVVIIIRAFRSSCPVTGRPAPPSRTIRW
jgi:hypothetical protein